MAKVVIYLLLLSAFIQADSRDRREVLDKFVVDYPFRIFYTTTGQDRIVDSRDLNKNSIPDYVEDTLIHLKLADYIFSNSLNLTPPLESKKYKKAKYIDVNILNLKNKKHLGQAMDAIIKYDRKADAKEVYTLNIDIRPDLDGRGFTPIHELFHLYMNGYTDIKNRWLTEGLARVSQRAFGYGKLNYQGSDPFPVNSTQRSRLYEKSYDAFSFWNELMYRLYGDTKIEDLDKILTVRYVDGRYVLDDFKMYGFKFLRPFFEELQKSDVLIESDRGLDDKAWKSSDKFSEKNNPYIWRAIKNTILKERRDRIKSDPYIRAIFLMD